MSDVEDPGGDFEPDDGSEVTPEQREAFDALLGKQDDIEEALRPLGMYLEGLQLILSNSGPVVVAQVMLGDVAFSDRVQNPAAYSVDSEFREMMAAQGADSFLDVRNQIQRNIAEGRNPLDNG